MLYTPLTNLALKLAYTAHHGQTDKAGLPYIHHPLHLAEQMDTEAETCVALLHDVIEDASVTLNELEQAGFSAEIITAVKLLTHDPQIPYEDYILQIKTNPLATKIKIADLMHNADITRLPHPGSKDYERIKKYHHALSLLQAE